MKFDTQFKEAKVDPQTFLGPGKSLVASKWSFKGKTLQKELK
jgi:hypothetical protein